jgi:MFS family permease
MVLSFMLFFIGRWHLDLVQAGSAIVPMGLVVVLLTTRVGRLADLVGYRTPIAAGAGLMATGLGLSAAWLSGDHFAAPWLALAVLLGLGVGLCYPLLAAAAVHGLDRTDLAAASALNQSGRQLGAALGVAMSVGVLGPAATPSLARFHAVWLIAAGFCVLAAAAATVLPSASADAGRSVSTTPPPPNQELSR